MANASVQGNVYTPRGPEYVFTGPGNNSWFVSPSALEDGNRYYARSKPQYEDVPASLFYSPHSFGAKGDGISDDTDALNDFFQFISTCFNQGCVGFIDAGYYKVTQTILILGSSRIVGEALASVIMGSGPNFSDTNNPRPVVQVGQSGQKGYIEWSDMFVSTQGATAGAILIEYNLQDCSCQAEPSAMWDVHIRVGGFAGSQLQRDQCIKTPDEVDVIELNCVAAYIGMHITAEASSLYMENNWFWVAE